MIDHLSSPMSRINVGVNNTTSTLDGLNAKFGGIAKAGVTMAATGQQITSALMEPIQATFETKEAIGQLSALGIQDLDALSSAAYDFSSKWAGTQASDFLTAAYDIKSGIASLSDEGVAKYTEMAGLTAKATKSSTGEMTSLFATGYGIYKDFYNSLSDIEFGEIFSSGIAESVKIFKTSGSGMAQSIQTLGATATTAQVPLEEQLAILGTLQATMSGSEAGTKYRAFLQTAAKAGSDLGLSFLDANNQLRSLPEILGLLRSKYGDTLDAIEKQNIKKAFGSDEAVALIDQFYNKTDQLQSSILDLNSSMGQGMAVTQQMADTINSTDPNKWQVIQQKVQNLKEQIGNGLQPQFNQFLDISGRNIERLSSWIGRNQQLVNIILIVVAVLGVVLTVGGAAIGLIGGIGLIVTKTIALGSSIAKAAAALPGLVSSVWGFTTALLANPVTWIVIGIIALIAVIILLWRNWDKVTAFLTGAWNAAGAGIRAGIDWIKSGIEGVATWINGKIAWFGDSGRKIVTTLTNGIKSVINMPADAIRGAFGKLRKLLPFSDAKEGPLSKLTLSGRRVLETVTTGIGQAERLPAQAVDKSFGKINLAAKKAGKISLREVFRDTQQSSTNESTTEREDGIYINEFNMLIDPTKIKSLADLERLMQWIMDYIRSHGGTPIPTEV